MQAKIRNIISLWKKSLGFRLSFFIMSVTILLFAGTLLTCLFVVEHVTTARVIKKTNDQMANAIEVINLNLRSIEETTRDYALFARLYTSSKSGCYTMCENLLENNPEIYAATIIFRPDYSNTAFNEQQLFVPYVSRKNGSKGYVRENLMGEFDLPSFYKWANGIWQQTIKAKEGYWVEPYIDYLVSNDYLESFSYPIRDARGKAYAVLCVDIQLKWLERRANSLKPTKNTNIAITTSKGNFLVHHIPAFIGVQDSVTMKRRIDKLYKEKKINAKWLEMHEKLQHGEQGMTQIKYRTYFSMAGKTDTITPGFFIYAPIKETGWTMSAVCPKSDIMEQTNYLLSRVFVCSVIGLVIMAIALYYMVRKMISPYKKFAAIDADIKTAAGIQNALVPKRFPKRENINNVDFYASMKPAKDVGGDLYDYVLDGDILTFVIGDVSGKGVPASLFMAGATMLFRAFAKQDKTSAEILTHINDNLVENNELNMFITMFICKMNVKTGYVDFCNGGHNAPVLIHDGKAQFVKSDTNLPIGVMEGLKFKNGAIDLVRGDTLLLYTDGVTEAENVHGVLYSDDRLLQFLVGREYTDARDLCESLSADIALHAGNAEQSDDITMICVGV